MPSYRYTHGSESFYIVGEGLLTTQVGGRSGKEPDPLNESEEPKTATATQLAKDEPPPFRFTRVGPKGTPLSPTIIKKLARAMIDDGTEGPGRDGDVPGGYTYLGQFVDHDLTMDITKVKLGKDIRPADMVQGRSPRLDLDSLYGAGPGDEESSKFYRADGLHMKTGDTIARDQVEAKAGHDLPRVGTGNTAKAKKAALIADPRNDENLIVAQTHLVMIHFHNQVLDSLPKGLPDTQKFARARELVTLHYQWLLRHDFLPRICSPKVLNDVFQNGRKLVEPEAGPHTVPTMPVEFSVAAFRLGHSMVRQAYNWNRKFAGTNGSISYMFDFSALGGDLGGNLKLASNWIADWRRMYDFGAAGHPKLEPASKVNHARRIDTILTFPLSFLPPSTFGGPPSAGRGFQDNLAFRNLMRGRMVKLASGQQMAKKLMDLGADVQPLTKAQILNGSGGAKLDTLSPAERDAVADRTPLWFYILREAELNDGVLTGVGARIVAETFHRAMEGSRFSIVRDPKFRPKFGRKNKFEMSDLIFFAFAGKKSDINPVGGK
jgi:hypothetical protein